MSQTLCDESVVRAVHNEVVRWFDTATVDRTLWAADAEVDAWQPVTRIQVNGIGAIAEAYQRMYPAGQEVIWSTAVATERGVLVEFTVRSRDDERRFAKECAVIDTDGSGLIRRFRLHCAGEWPAATEQAFLADGGSLSL